MKLMILAGGLGTRISEESHLRPKPMIEIGGKPILWHIMKIYSSFGINEFIICCGYKGYQIKEYFFNYSLHMSDVTFDMEHDSVKVHSRNVEPWKVTLVDTGESTMTGGRLRRAAPYLDGDDVFCMTYGDGVGDVNIRELLAFHSAHGKLATLTAVHPPARFGALEIQSDDEVVDFREKLEQRRRPDQRGILRPVAQGDRVHRRGSDDLGARPAGAHGARAPAQGIPPPRLLAAHGHLARPDACSKSYGRAAAPPGRRGQ